MLDKVKIDQDLRDGTSLLSRQYNSSINLIEEHFKLTMRNINMGEPSQLISLMAKIDYDEDAHGGGLWVTDGLVVCNT